MIVPGKEDPDAVSVDGVMMDPVDDAVIVVAVVAAAVVAVDGVATVSGMVCVVEPGCNGEVVWPVTGGDIVLRVGAAVLGLVRAAAAALALSCSAAASISCLL